MIILGSAAGAGLVMMWALVRCPLARAVMLSVNRFADATHADPGGLD